MNVTESVRTVIVVSDLHCGCRFGLCPPKFLLDGGGDYEASSNQKIVFGLWEKEFWGLWVPTVTKGEDYIVVNNGDTIDGVHHNTTTQFSHNLSDQRKLAVQILEPIVQNPKCKAYFHIRGTEAHGGQSGEHEEEIAKDLGAIPDEFGSYSRWEMWLNLQGHRIHFTHHISTTSSQAYESTGPHKEMIEAYNEAGRSGEQPPDAIVRSHRHRGFSEKVFTKNGYGISLVTPGWQLKTPLTYRILLGRSGTPDIGGSMLRIGDEDGLYDRTKVWKMKRPQEVVIGENSQSMLTNS